VLCLLGNVFVLSPPPFFGFWQRSRSYGERLQQSGITVDVGYVGWFSTRWNALFATLNQRYHGFLKVWFTIATWFALVCMVVSVVLVVAALVAQFTRPRDQQILSPVVRLLDLVLFLFSFCVHVCVCVSPCSCQESICP